MSQTCLGPTPCPGSWPQGPARPAQVALSGQLLGEPAPFVATIGPNPKVWPNICTNLQGYLRGCVGVCM